MFYTKHDIADYITKNGKPAKFTDFSWNPVTQTCLALVDGLEVYWRGLNRVTFVVRAVGFKIAFIDGNDIILSPKAAVVDNKLIYRTK